MTVEMTEERAELIKALNAELFLPLGERYLPEDEGNCRVCGEELTIGEAANGKLRWHCSSKAADWLRGGGSIQHWRESETVTRNGDSTVIALVELTGKMAQMLTTDQLRKLVKKGD
jgi:hypothetical protein